MTCIEMAEKLGFAVVNVGQGNVRTIDGVYCCDLLSVVMGRAKENDVWITVMGNINSIAVAVLSDVSCILLSEGMSLDDEASEKAISQDVCVLRTHITTYEAARCIGELLDKAK